MRLTLADVFVALGYRSAVNPGQSGPVFTSVSTDTRTLKRGALFIALANERHDGHEHISHAIRAGATGVIVSKEVVVSRDVPAIKVPDSTVAYGLIGRYWRDKFAIPVVGVTGSVGKTSTKELLGTMLQCLGPVVKTTESQNTETGVPRTLLTIDTNHRSAVVEMGMRGKGQIADLCQIASPTIGVVTLIGDNHIELLGSRQAIAEAKSELIAALPIHGLAVLPADDPYFSLLAAPARCPVRSFGLSAAADIRADHSERVNAGWKFSVGGTPVYLPSPSKHEIVNSLAGFAVAEALGCSREQVAAALAEYQSPPMRMEVIRTSSGVIILNDAYNAAPDSLASSLKTLVEYSGTRKFAFIGDMRELGQHTVAAHQRIGDLIEELGGLDGLITVGNSAAVIGRATARFETSEEAADYADNAVSFREGDVILVKGSRAVAMERVVEALQGAMKGPLSS